MKFKTKSAVSLVFLSLVGFISQKSAFAAKKAEGICTCDLKDVSGTHYGVKFVDDMYSCLHNKTTNILSGTIKDKNGKPIGPNEGFKKVASCTFEKFSTNPVSSN